MGKKVSKSGYRNSVVLSGRIGAAAQERELPSGDSVAEFRLIIERDDRDGVDTLDIACWKAPLRRRALTLKADEWISIEGVIRRRFWRAGPTLASRWQVEARELRRV